MECKAVSDRVRGKIALEGPSQGCSMSVKQEHYMDIW